MCGYSKIIVNNVSAASCGPLLQPIYSSGGLNRQSNPSNRVLPIAALKLDGNNNLVLLVIFCLRFEVIFVFEKKENNMCFVVNEIIPRVAIRYVVITVPYKVVVLVLVVLLLLYDCWLDYSLQW